VACGEKHFNVEPDAQGYRCGGCGGFTVFGVYPIILMEACKEEG